MFTFGIFSTHIPYLVFLFFYLTYFLFSNQLGEKKELVEEFIFGKKEIVQDGIALQDDNFAYYHQADNDHKADQIKHQARSFILQNTIKPGPGDRIGIANFYALAGLVVNRPPPSRI